MLEYAPDGLIGVLTPQANTTVEPELAILCPPGTGMITARLTSPKDTISARLADYAVSLDRALEQFANAPVRAVTFACTGTAYVVDPRADEVARAATEARVGYPIFTGAGALIEALSVLGARRICLVSPYPDAVHDAAVAFWQAQPGLTIARMDKLVPAEAAFHPIYALGSDGADATLSDLREGEVDAVAILGTGLPTLAPILRMGAHPVPVLSPNVCLMWRAVCALRGQAPSVDNLRPWINGQEWGGRLRAFTRSAAHPDDGKV